MGDAKSPAFKLELEESGDECFEDAQDELESPMTPMEPQLPLPPPGSIPNLEEGLAVATQSLALFLSNKFEEAKEIVGVASDYSMYHSISHSTILGLQAMMTLEQNDIALALEAARKSYNVTKRSRRKQSMLLWNRSKVEYSQEELHAELVYAECLLLYALLTFLEDENLVSFVKAALKIRRCYLAYQECYKLLARFQFDSTAKKADFESGVRLGYGLFNILISNLPPRIMHLLEFVGFSGDREVGLKELNIGVDIDGGLRTPLCWLTVLVYNLVAVYAFGLTQNNLPQSEEILRKALTKYPESVLFLFFKGKFEQVSGRFLNALQCYEGAVNSQCQWHQFHHLCYWEEMATNALLADWLLAMKLAEHLYQNSRWSKALYQYLKGIFMLELISQYQRNPDDQNDADTIKAMQSHVSQLMEAVPNMRQKIAGKSVPIEKFAAAKAVRYLKTGKICLPGVEIIFILNWARILSSDQASCERILRIIDEELQVLDCEPTTKGPDEKFKIQKTKSVANDDLALAVFLRGAVLRELGRRDEATMWLRACSANWSESNLSGESTYVLPGSLIELAYIAVDNRDLKLARSYLDSARSFKQYHNVSRMQFRIHALQQEITAMEGRSKQPKGALLSVTNENPQPAMKSKTAPTSLSAATTK